MTTHSRVIKSARRGLLRSMAATAMLGLGLTVGVSAQTTGAPVRFGAVLAMSGPGAVFGIPMRDAITVALEDVNKKGGINGRPVEVIFYDDRTDASEAARGVTQVINRDKVVAIIGPGTGGNVLASGPIAERMKVPLLAPVGTIAVTDRKNAFHPWVFRTAPSDEINVRTILAYAAKQGAKRIGIFHQEDAYGKTGVDVANLYAKDLNQEIVAIAAAPYSATDLTAQAIRLREAKVDAVFMQVSIAAMGATFIKAAKQVGLDAPLYGNSGLAQKTFVDSAGAAVEGFRVLSIGNLVYEPSAGEQRLAEMLRAGGKQPQGWGELVGSNGLMTAVAAARSIKGEITGQTMRDAVEGLCGYEAFSRGKPCFSREEHSGWHEDALVITEIAGGKLRTRK